MNPTTIRIANGRITWEGDVPTRSTDRAARLTDAQRVAALAEFAVVLADEPDPPSRYSIVQPRAPRLRAHCHPNEGQAPPAPRSEVRRVPTQPCIVPPPGSDSPASVRAARAVEVVPASGRTVEEEERT